MQPAGGLQLSTESAEHLLAKTFVLAAKRARLVSVACLRGLQLGAVSCPGPSLAPLEPLGFSGKEFVLYFDGKIARNLKTDRNLLLFKMC